MHLNSELLSTNSLGSLRKGFFCFFVFKKEESPSHGAQQNDEEFVS